MKKHIKFIAVVTIVAAAAVLVGCKKDNAPTGNSQPEAKAVSPSEQKVLEFLADFGTMKQGLKTEGEAVTIEEARWQWETALNYCYGFTQDYLQDMRRDTVRVSMPKTDANGEITSADLLETYEDIVEAVREQYKSIVMDGKTLQFVMISIGESNAKDGGDDVIVVMNTGSGREVNAPDPGPWYGTPFHYGECYVWGHIGPFSATDDAAYQVENRIAAYDANHMLYYAPCPTCYTYIENPYVYATHIGNLETDSLFFETGLTEYEAIHDTLCYQFLNKEYAYALFKGHYEGMPTNRYGLDWYYKTEVRDLYRGGPEYYSIYHVVTIWHCTRWWRNGDVNYPVQIDTEE